MFVGGQEEKRKVGQGTIREEEHHQTREGGSFRLGQLVGEGERAGCGQLCAVQEGSRRTERPSARPPGPWPPVHVPGEG